METRYLDWKDVANSRFSNALALALVLVLFGVLVVPRVDMTKTSFEPGDIIIITPPTDTPEKIVNPVVVKPVLNLTIDPLQTERASDLADVRAALESFDDGIIIPPQMKQQTKLAPGFEIYEVAPEVITLVRPVYPEYARKNHITGRVVLDVEVYKDGKVGNITVHESLLSGPYGLDQAAIDAVKQWSFQPGLSNGHPVNTVLRIPLEFSLSKE